jgi:hypothetical protein
MKEVIFWLQPGTLIVFPVAVLARPGHVGSRPVRASGTEVLGAVVGGDVICPPTSNYDLRRWSSPSSCTRRIPKHSPFGRRYRYPAQAPLWLNDLLWGLAGPLTSNARAGSPISLGCSGLLNILGPVIQVLYNLVFENYYLKIYIKFLLPDILGSVFRLPKIPKITSALQQYNSDFR